MRTKHCRPRGGDLNFCIFNSLLAFRSFLPIMSIVSNFVHCV